MRQAPEFLRFLKRVADRVFFNALNTLLKKDRQSSPETLLIVRTDGIGDFVYFSRYILALHAAHPSRRIVIVCRTETAPIAASMKYIDHVIAFDYLRYRHNYLYRLAVLRSIRTLLPEVTVYASYHRQQIGDEMTLLSGAQTTVAFSGNNECIHESMRRKNNAYFSIIIEAPDHRPEQAKYALLMKALRVDPDDSINDGAFLSGYCSKNDVSPSSRRILDSLQRFVVIAPGASAPVRRWKPEKFAMVADAINEEYGLSVVLCGNSEDKQRLDLIAGTMKQKSVIIVQFTLLEVIELIKRAACIVGNDSGLLHIAASVKTPGIGLIGGWHFNRYFPYGTIHVVNHYLDCYECNLNCIYPEPYCLTDITVEDVLRGVKELGLK